MRIELTSIVVGFVLTAQFAYSADVAYQLPAESLQSKELHKPAEPGRLAIVNREWAIPGVEEATFPLGPATKFEFASGGPCRLRIEGEGPGWLDDVCFPLTRQVFHSWDLPRTYFAPVLCDGLSVRTQERPSPFDF